MCQATHHIHSQCGHTRSLEITHPCSSSSSSPLSKHPTSHTHTPCSTPYPILQNLISDPPRCAACSRRVQRNIIKGYEIKHQDCEARLRDLRWGLRGEMDRGRREAIRGAISGVVEEMGDLIDRRNEEVEEVRFRQGGGGMGGG